MRSAIKQISFMIFALMLNLVWANSRLDEVAFFQDIVSVCSDCQDTSDPFDYFHSICCEDDVYTYDSIVKWNRADVMQDKILLFKDFIQKEYISKIWQPPKFFF
jgi:hypothetical protein